MNKQTVIRKQSAVPWFFLSVAVFALSMVVGFTVIPRSLAAEEVMVIWQSEDGKVFGTQTELDIFNDPHHDGQKIIDPFTKGAYNFVVENRSADTLLDYQLRIISDNEHNIPLVFSIIKNGAYIFGDKDGKLRLGERLDGEGAPDPEILPGNLGGNKADLYTLEWEWEQGRNSAFDARDTNQFGNVAVNENIEYKITFLAEGEGTTVERPGKPSAKRPTPTPAQALPETELPEIDPPLVSPPLDPPQETELPEIDPPLAMPSVKPSISSPKTGDYTNIVIWISLLLASMAFLIPLVFFKRRKNKDESDKVSPEII